MKQDADFFKKRRKYIKQLKDRRRAYAKLVGDIQQALELEFRDLRRSYATQLAFEIIKPNPDPELCAKYKKDYDTIMEITGGKNEDKNNKRFS